MAELELLDWKAVDLERKFIEIRAGQAKTASRRVIPISDNLAAWLMPLERKGKIVCTGTANPCVRAGPRPHDGMAEQRASEFIHQSPHRHRPECRSGHD